MDRRERTASVTSQIRRRLGAYSVCSALLLVSTMCVAASAQDTQPPATQLAQLHAVLQSDAARLPKIQACKRLATLSDPSSVRVVAPLLLDPELSHAARLVLEPMSDPAAGQALRTALARAEGPLAVGIINSLGARRDVEAVPDLARVLSGEDQAPASAAAFALGRIATDQAVDVLSRTMSTARNGLAVAMANGCLMAAEQCLRDGRRPEAAKLCDAVMESDVPDYLRMSATRRSVLAADSLGEGLLQRLLTSAKDVEFEMALMLVREFPQASTVSTVGQQLPQLPVARQVLVLQALGDCGDKAALDVVLAARETADQRVCMAATRSLVKLGGEGAGPLLLEIACGADDAEARVALEALVQVPGTDIDAAIIDRLKDAAAASPLQRKLCQLTGWRGIAGAVDLLCEAAAGQDSQHRLVAIEALGRTIPAERLEFLTSRLLSSSGDELAAVTSALRTACTRLGDSETCAQQLVQCLARSEESNRFTLLELLGIVGGPTALSAVSQAAEDADPETLDTVTRILGAWMTPDAAPLLLELARRQIPDKFRVRGLRGYIRILRQFDMTRQQRIEMCQQAMPMAERPEERLLMLDALLRMPGAETLQLATTQLDQPEVRDRACEVCLLLSNNLTQQHPQAVTEAMDKVLGVTENTTFQGYAKHLRAEAQRSLK